jgi:hypothetical protein
MRTGLRLLCSPRSSAPLSAILIALAMLFAHSSAFAQAQAANGVIEGTVTDPSGSVVAGARVKITNLDNGIAREVVTNESGF